MSTNASALVSTAEKRNELNRRTNRGAIHEVGIFIGLLLTADKVDKVDKVVDIWSRSLDEKIVLCVAAAVFLYLIVVRFRDGMATYHLVNELADEAGSETSTDNGGD